MRQIEQTLGTCGLKGPSVVSASRTNSDNEFIHFFSSQYLVNPSSASGSFCACCSCANLQE